MDLLGVGVPTWLSPSTHWDWWPFLGIMLALVIARRSLRIVLRPTVLVGAVSFGPVFALLVHSWGAVAALASVALVAGSLSWVRTRRMGDDSASAV